jgi:hypothetical protein
LEGHLDNRILAPLKEKHHKVLCMIKPLAIGFIKIGLVLGIALSRPLFQESPWPCDLCTKEISSSSLQFVVVKTLLFMDHT